MKKSVIILIITVAVVVITAVISLVFLILKADKGIEYVFEDDSFSVHASLVEDQTIKYSDIEKLEIREDIDIGSRTFGYGSFKLSMGHFSNDLFGDYILYCYNDCNTLVVLHLKDGSVIVLGGENKASSLNIYKTVYGNLP